MSAHPSSRLRGVNLAGWLVARATPGHWRHFIDEADVARLASWRFTHVRLPLDEAVLDEPDGWAALESALACCLEAGLACVLTLQIDQTGLFIHQARWASLLERWRSIARHCRHWPAALAFCLLDRPDPPDDLLPEALAALGAPRPSLAARRPLPPGATGARAWNALALRLTQAIREIDEQRPLVVESSQRASPAAFAFLRPTRDPHTLYSFHCFAPEPFTLRGEGTYPGLAGGEPWDRHRLEQLLQPALEFRRIYEAPLYLGAFGVAITAPRTAQLTWVRTLVSLCHRHGLGWAYWAYKAYEGNPFGLICDSGPCRTLPAFTNPQRLDYDLLGILQSEA